MGLWTQFQLLGKTMLITLLAYFVGDINLTFKTVYSEMLGLLIWLFESKEGQVIFSTEPACAAYFWAPQRGKAKVLCCLIHSMRPPTNSERTDTVYPNVKIQTHKRVKWESGETRKGFGMKVFVLFCFLIMNLNQPCRLVKKQTSLHWFVM